MPEMMCLYENLRFNCSYESVWDQIEAINKLDIEDQEVKTTKSESRFTLKQLREGDVSNEESIEEKSWLESC